MKLKNNMEKDNTNLKSLSEGQAFIIELLRKFESKIEKSLTFKAYISSAIKLFNCETMLVAFDLLTDPYQDGISGENIDKYTRNFVQDVIKTPKDGVARFIYSVFLEARNLEDKNLKSYLLTIANAALDIENTKEYKLYITAYEAFDEDDSQIAKELRIYMEELEAGIENYFRLRVA